MFQPSLIVRNSQIVKFSLICLKGLCECLIDTNEMYVYCICTCNTYDSYCITVIVFCSDTSAQCNIDDMVVVMKSRIATIKLDDRIIINLGEQNENSFAIMWKKLVSLQPDLQQNKYYYYSKLQ